MMSRKRKLSIIEVPSAASEFHLPCKSSLREFGSFSGADGQGNCHGIFLNQEKYLRPETLRHQFQSDEYQQTNDFKEARFTSGAPDMMPESSQFREPSPPLKMPAGEMPEINFTPRLREMNCHTEQPRSLPVQRLHGKNAEKCLLEAVPEGQMRSWDKNHNSPDIVSMEMSNVSTEFVRPERTSVQSSLPNDSQTRAGCKGANESGNSFELRQSGQCSNNPGTVKFPYEQIEYVGASNDAGQMENESSLQSKIRSVCSSPSIPLGVDSESRGAYGVGDSKSIESRAAAKKFEPSVTSMSSSKSINNVGDGLKHGHAENLSQDSKKLDGKSRSPGKRTFVAAEKLWEGSLQLNSSTTVSAVAFFKSGEKLLDINWSECVEVKGKVRLEAFEKYIQDLPRSRTRGLMVISLCWKEGSSESGLKSMKEVAKAYRKGERVGLARLSPGVDVYLCPRSNTIITILAKHGFFKGKAAVEDNSELLIGCVVWRKQQTTACSTEKRSENKSKSKQEQLLKSPSDASSNQQVEGSSSFAPPVQNSKSLASVDSSSAVENVSVNESKNVAIGNQISSRNLLPTPPISEVSSIPVGQQNPSYSTLPIEGSKGQLAEIGAASARFLEAEYPKTSIGVPRSVITVPTNVMKGRIPSADVDDLPEFDFGNTDETSVTSVSKPLDAFAFNKRLQNEENKNSDFMMAPKIAAIHSGSGFNTRASNSSVRQLPSTFNPEIPVRGTTDARDRQVFVQQRNDGSHSLQTNSSSTFASSKVAFERFGKKNLFDDDDDMPEWIPPEQKTSSAEVKEPSLTISSSNTSSQSLPVGTSVQPHPPPFPAASLPEYSSQAFQPSYRPPPHVKILPPVPPKHIPSSLTGFTFTPLLRPPSTSSPIQRPLLPGDKRGSRP